MFKSNHLRALTVFRYTGIVLFLFIPILIIKKYWINDYAAALSLLAPFAITTSALIAGFSVEKSIETTIKLKEEDKQKSIEKANKIIAQTLIYLIREAEEQKKALENGLEIMIQLGLGKDFFYSDMIIKEKIISALDKMTDKEIIGVLEPETIEKMYILRYQTLSLIHQYNILKTLVMANEFGEMIKKQIQSIISLLKNMITDYMKELELIQKS